MLLATVSTASASGCVGMWVVREGGGEAHGALRMCVCVYVGGGLRRSLDALVILSTELSTPMDTFSPIIPSLPCLPVCLPGFLYQLNDTPTHTIPPPPRLFGVFVCADFFPSTGLFCGLGGRERDD